MSTGGICHILFFFYDCHNKVVTGVTVTQKWATSHFNDDLFLHKLQKMSQAIEERSSIFSNNLNDIFGHLVYGFGKPSVFLKS